MNDAKDVHSRFESRLGNDKALNKKEMAEIYDQHYLSIYRYIFRQIGDVEVSKEIASDVFHRMVERNQNSTVHLEYLTSWLYCVARNIVADYYRRQQHRRHLSFDDKLIVSSHDTAENAETQIRTEKMRIALMKLTPDQRQVIILKFMEGFSNQEVADALSKPVSAVKALQHRALVALRRLLDPVEERVIA